MNYELHNRLRIFYSAQIDHIDDNANERWRLTIKTCCRQNLQSCSGIGIY